MTKIGTELPKLAENLKEPTKPAKTGLKSVKTSQKGLNSSLN